MRFGVLGPLAVWTEDGTPVRVPEVKVRALLARLLVAEGRPVPVDALAAALWGDRPPSGNTLQTRVSALRKAIGRDAVVWQPPGYAVRYSWLDLAEFRALAAAGSFDEALALWRGEPLAEFDGFAAGFARRVAEERLTVVEDRAAARLAVGQPVALDDEVARHPLRERLRALHMRSLYLAGQQVEALESFASYRRVLAREQGLEPGPDLVALQRTLLRHEVRRPRTNLPAPVTSLVGRDAAVAEVGALLGSSRLVTLTGPGGVGKTSLAVEVARSLGDAVADGVWLVELAGLDRAEAGAERVAAAVASVLGVREEVGVGMPDGLVDRLAEAFRGRDVLLVLDNCERLVEAVAAVVSRLLRGAAGLRVVVTSQEPLGVTGEAVWVVPPLEPADAVRLFAVRAAAVAPGFVVTPEVEGVVERICRKLDGLPLALELAATRVRA
ncbi:MAG: AfsR/SARP family transcriptional regulator, partial [Saccharothrix sp.]|nr:AfsR/SARP family transcriptional regulator [Saccharothrix sp.]